MMRLLNFELHKLLYKPRTYLSMALVGVLVLLIFWGLKSEGEVAIDYLLQALKANFVLEGRLLNAWLVIYFTLNTLWIHVPILIIIVTGDLFSSELESGTIRLIITRPIRRSSLVLAKHLTAIAFVFLFVLFWSLLTVLPSFSLFGGGDLVVLFNGLQILEESVLPWRFVAAFAFGFLGMSALAVFSVTVSFFTRRSLVTILITLGAIVISTLLQTLASGLFHGWENFLITYQLAQWQLFFYTTPDWANIVFAASWLVLFSLLCIVVSIWRFNRLKITE
ncbi:ABC transporter permease [Mangrovibacterium diazotrophicum]|uniref:ABC-2 type transport system permease protein n=1 Tax=Mangrovibacterium diazotrophicum TaxID=1261403 RepID=A0A419W423_9BACT|nr:ABC transporter permease [Mangrovibacterium diazotrophicum]RKD90203.1 ABC-2 type transport system permease protein [Mangrovibacterium diazotrophicum]